MDNEQAKLILSTYRPSGEDASDPFFAEALDQVRRDPELSQWFTEQRRFDQSIQSALASIKPPDNLRGSLFINSRVVRFTQPNNLGDRVRLHFKPWMAVAAAMLIFLGSGLFIISSHQPAKISIDRVVHVAFDLERNDKITHGKTGGGNEALRAWLANQGSPADFVLPHGLETVDGMGCQTINIDGYKISLICFVVDKEKDHYVHFFVIDSNALEYPPGAHPAFIKSEQLTAMTWSAVGRTYVLLSRDLDDDALSSLI